MPFCLMKHKSHGGELGHLKEAKALLDELAA